MRLRARDDGTHSALGSTPPIKRTRTVETDIVSASDSTETHGIDVDASVTATAA